MACQKSTSVNAKPGRSSAGILHPFACQRYVKHVKFVWCYAHFNETSITLQKNATIAARRFFLVAEFRAMVQITALRCSRLLATCWEDSCLGGTKKGAKQKITAISPNKLRWGFRCLFCWKDQLSKWHDGQLFSDPFDLHLKRSLNKSPGLSCSGD